MMALRGRSTPVLSTRRRRKTTPKFEMDTLMFSATRKVDQWQNGTETKLMLASTPRPICCYGAQGAQGATSESHREENEFPFLLSFFLYHSSTFRTVRFLNVLTAS